MLVTLIGRRALAAPRGHRQMNHNHYGVWPAVFASALLASTLSSEISMAAHSGSDAIKLSSFGTLPNGTPVMLYTLRNGRGMEARIMTYGGIVVSLTAPDRSGRYIDVVLGYDSFAG